MTKARLKAKFIPLLALFGVVCLVMFVYRGITYAARNKKANQGGPNVQDPWKMIVQEFNYFFTT